MPASSNSSIPPIRTFQFDASSLGDLQSSVNLFRGDVNYNQKLLSMPGRRHGDGLAVNLTLFYQSNVYYDAMTWNRDAPTGVAGLGWSLPLTFIQLDDGGSATLGAWQYSFVSDGISTSLAREPDTPLLLSVSSFAGTLSKGQVPADLRTEFVQRGIPLSEDATLAGGTSGQWTLADDTNQQLFTLTLDNDLLEAFDGGESYQLVNYRFWKVLYYRQYERWVIIKEDGQRLSFGGGTGKTSQGYATSAGNSIEWGVRWYAEHGGNTSGAAWIGPSALTTGQGQYARVWHLASAASPWGDSVSYGYNEWTRDTESGLIPDVEQLVGDGGLPYTKACYLTSITDVFGRKVFLTYDDKLWTDPTTTPEGPREYADPHKPAPNTDPNAFQDCYETKFLEKIAVYGVRPGQGKPGPQLFSLTLLYQPGGSDTPVANVTTYTGALFGDTSKRFLTGIVFTNADGDSLPGLLFSYYLESSQSSASPGALKSITYPQGGIATYTYTCPPQSLDVCDRMVSVPPPSGFQHANPRVFFGDDYVVTTWYEPAQGKLSMQVFTWLGRWEGWQLLTNDPVLFSNSDGLDPTTLDVLAAEEFFALSFNQVNQGDTFDVYVFQKDIAHPGQWKPTTVNRTTTGQNKPTLQYPSTGTITISGGDAFLIISVMDPGNLNGTYDRVTWRWYDSGPNGIPGAWTYEHFTVDSFSYVTAQNEYYLLLDVNGNVSLFYLDPALVWQKAAQALQIPNFSVQNLAQEVALAPADSFVVVSHLTGDATYQLIYTLYFLQWDETYTYTSQSPQSFTFTDPQEPSGNYPTTWVPTVVNNTTVGVAAHLLCYNGQTWLDNDTLQVNSPPSGQQQRYAYGPDCAVQILADESGGGGTPTAKVLSFDPDSDYDTWNRSAVAPTQPLSSPTLYSTTANWPSAGEDGDFLAVGQYLYFRGTATSWDDVVQGSPTDIQAAVNTALGAKNRYVLSSQSVVNESPQFLAYFVYDTQKADNQQVAATVLRNGQIDVTQTLTSERMYTSAEQGQGAGFSPGGPDAFVGYPASDNDFNSATKIILHHYAGYAIEKNLVHYAVAGVTVDNGFGDSSSTSYVFDTSTAACDPTGLVIKYYTATVYPGANDPTKPVFGWRVNHYLNGLAYLSAPDFYNMMDGLLHQVEVYDNDGKLLSQTTNTWTGYVTRASDPTDPTCPVMNLQGAFVVQTEQNKIVDGVPSSKTLDYIPEKLQELNTSYSGQVVSTTTKTFGGTGAAETFTTTTTYGYEVDNPRISGPLLALHMLTTRAQSETTWSCGSTSNVTARASATTYSSSPSAWGSDVLVPGKEAGFTWLGPDGVPFPFSSYTAGSSPDGWLLSTRILGRTAFGQIAAQEDGCGTVQSTLYGTNSEFSVAHFLNASVLDGECAYYGFESYEDSTGWTIAGASVVTGDAHTGENGLSLPGGGTAALSTQVTPPNVNSVYLLGFWYKTPSGFTASSGTGFSITVSVDGASEKEQQIAFKDTGGQWAYQTAGIPLTAGQKSISISVKAANTSSDPVLLDDIFITPLVGKLAVKAYDPAYRLVTSTLDSSGHTVRTIYDDFQRKIVAVGPDEQLKHLTQAFFSREGSASDVFESTSPNTKVTVEPAEGGSLETFLTGDEWQTRWKPSGYPSNWSQANGTLAHTGSNNDTLTWQGFAGATPATAALFFELQPSGSLSSAVGITFGQSYTIAYDPRSGFSFTDSGGTSVQSPLASPPDLPRQWLLVMGAGIVLFFGDGQLLFSAKVSPGNTGAVTFFTGSNALSIRDLAMMAAPRVALTYEDATGQQRQVQQLQGDDAVISAVVRDALGRTVAVTRAAPASFGNGASLPVLSYHSTFVDVEGFLAAMSDSWEMTGDVADYYQGQSDGPVARSNDQGYPYYGYRFESSPRKRRLEQGVPGKDYAIHDLASTTPADRQTVQMLYGESSGSGFGFPDSDSYYCDTLISPIKTQSIELKDTTGRKVATTLSDASGTAVGQSLGDTIFGEGGDANSGNTLAIKQPNSFTNGPQTDPSAFVSTIVHNPADQIVQRTDPDTQTTAFVYDATSRLRFVQPALDSGQQGFVYTKYDALGRIVEQGTVAQAWDPAQLAQVVNNAAWPDSSVSPNVTRTYLYDGDGNDPTLIGQKVSVQTVNGAPSTDPSAGDLTVGEAFTYDTEGRVSSVAMTVSGENPNHETISYAYNNLHQMTQVTYPDGAPLGTVIYIYDDNGRITGVGSSAQTPTDIASYTYTADGDVEQEIRNQGTLQGAFQYESPGWLSLQAVTVQGTDQPSFSLGYTYQANGVAKARTVSFAFSNPGSTSEVTYAYDGQNRLLSANANSGASGSESIGQYDANGNIWSLTQDEVSYKYTCAAGSDRLQSLSIGSGDAVSFTYSADGRLTQMGNLTFDYEAALNLTRGIAVSGNPDTLLRFAYGRQDQRVVKQVSGATSSSAVSFNGLSSHPLAIAADGKWTAFVYGPSGLVAAAGDTRYFPLKDHMGTIWGVVDDHNQLVSQYNYYAFGSLIGASGSDPSGIPFRFMGRESDPETDLYNFGARLYSPALRRFLAPDAARQYPSVYVFVGNNPVMMIDPSGNVSTAAQVGIGVAMGVVATAGFVLSFFTFGISDAVADAIDTALGTGAAATDTETLTGEFMASIGEGTSTAARASILAARLGVAAQLAANFAWQVGTNTAFGVGAAGLEYDIHPGGQFTSKGFGDDLKSGAISGAIFGAVSGLLGPLGEATTALAKGSTEGKAFLDLIKNPWLRGLAKISVNAVAGAASNDLSQYIINEQNHQSWDHRLISQTWIGATIEGASFGVGDILTEEGSVLGHFRDSGGSNLLRAKRFAAATAVAVANPQILGIGAGLIYYRAHGEQRQGS